MQVHYVKVTGVSGAMPSRRTFLVITQDGKSFESSPAVVFAPALSAVTEVRASQFGSHVEDVQFLHDALGMVRDWLKNKREDFSEFEPAEEQGRSHVHSGCEVTRRD
jgi:hypothetical protein